MAACGEPLWTPSCQLQSTLAPVVLVLARVEWGMRRRRDYAMGDWMERREAGSEGYC